MRKTCILISLASLLTLTSCMPVLSLFFGISEPKEVSAKKIEKKRNKYDLDYFKHYYITKEGFFSYFDILPRNNLETSVTRVLIFKNGKLLQPNVINGCTSQRSGFIRKLQDSTSYIVIDSVLLSDFVNNNSLYDFDDNEFKQENESKEFTIILYWATFSGVLNKSVTARLAQVTKDCMENKGLSAHAFYINLDVKEGWNEKFKAKRARK